jgi:hypothetical protein
MSISFQVSHCSRHRISTNQAALAKLYQTGEPAHVNELTDNTLPV